MEVPKYTKDLIEQWYKIAVESNATSVSALDNTYLRFMALWVAFNGLYDSRQWATGRRDAQQVKLFGEKDHRARARHQDLMQGDDEYRAAVSYLKDHQVECRCILEDEHSLKEIIECVYKVRNNLFHARKRYGELMDENLVKNSHKIVSELMLIEPYLSRRSSHWPR